MNQRANTGKKMDRTIAHLRWLSAIYILLLLFEGALRKWVLPSLSDILLLVRDPVVLAAYALAFSKKLFPINKYVISGLALMLIWACFTLLFGHKDPIVTFFGIRTNFLHLPMAFIMGKIFFRSDVIELGKWWLIATLVMTAIIVLQFYSPQSAWINLSVGGEEGGGFSGAMGRYRPPGTFSFIVGVVWFYTFSTAFLIAGITQHKLYPKWLIASSAMAIIIAIPVSISRSLILSVAITFLVGLFASSLQKNALLRYGRIALFAAIGLFAASQFPVFDEAREAFFARWENSTSEDQGGFKGAIIDRVLQELTGPFVSDRDLPLFGIGIGAGTQVGSQLLRGSTGFHLGEGEWDRVTAEGGLILGGLFIFWRIALATALLSYSFKSYRKGNGLALILLSATGVNLLIGQLGQSTILGFTVIGIGLTIASMGTTPTETKPVTKDKPGDHSAAPCKSS